MAEIVPNPLISRGVPAYSETNPSTASAANDEHYYSFWSGTAPDKLTYDLSEIPEKQRKNVIAVWYTTSTFDKIGSYASRNMIPTDYTVEVNAAEGGKCPESGWVIVETVENNSLASREHVLDMAGYNWIRLNIAKSDGKTGGQVSLNLDIHSVSDGIADSWLFLGDSITACGMNNCYGTGFATHLHNLDDRYFPIQENGGIGGITSSDGKNNIDRWLETFPGKFVSIAYGTNDAWGDQTGTQTYYNNTKYMIDAVLKSGKVPVLPKIPFSIEKGVAENLPKYNAMIDRLWTEYGDKLVKGADLEAFLGEHTEYLSGDGVHPSDVGYEAIRKFWAETMYNNVYTNSKFSTSSDDAVETLKYGDANCDGKINMGDVVPIMQNIADSGKYGLHGSDKSHITETGLKNADVSGNNDGVTLNDGLAIQKFKLDLIKSLPEE